MNPATNNQPRHTGDSHLLLTRSETRIWNQYQLTPNYKQTAEALGLKASTIETAVRTIREKIRAQNS